MQINGDYPRPVSVNGFACRNCGDVELAKKNIDPAHPQEGPFGVNARTDAAAARRDEPVRARLAEGVGRRLDISV